MAAPGSHGLSLSSILSVPNLTGALADVALCSHNSSLLATATFDTVTVGGNEHAVAARRKRSR